MRRTLMAGLGIVVAGLVACGDESPTGVGSDLMGPGVRTFEVLLDAPDFLVRDTTFDRIGTLTDANFRVVSHEFGGEVDARTLFSLLRPTTVTYERDGVTQTDSIEAVIGGVLTLIVDTVSTSPGPIALEVMPVTEDWHATTATWSLRVDTAGVSEPWEVPGGSPGDVLATEEWVGGDTLRIQLSAEAVAVLDDSAAAVMGGLVRTTTPDARLFITGMRFEFEAVPVEAPDTVILAGAITASKIIADPDMAPDPPPGVLRVGGLPVWRAAVRFRPLEEIRIPCGPAQPPGCTMPLADARLNLASLLLTAVPAGPHRLERPMRMDGRGVLEGPNVPLIRSPLTPPLGPATDTLPPALFAGGGNPGEEEEVTLPVTGFLQIHLSPQQQIVPPLWLALTSTTELEHLGFAAFAGLASDRPPRLRLLVSVPDELLIR